jgi:hypothetical protein
MFNIKELASNLFNAFISNCAGGCLVLRQFSSQFSRGVLYAHPKETPK